LTFCRLILYKAHQLILVIVPLIFDGVLTLNKTQTMGCLPQVIQDTKTKENCKNLALKRIKEFLPKRL